MSGARQYQAVELAESAEESRLGYFLRHFFTAWRRRSVRMRAADQNNVMAARDRLNKQPSMAKRRAKWY